MATAESMTTTTAVEYEPRSISSLGELQPGDHILVKERPSPQQQKRFLGGLSKFIRQSSSSQKLENSGSGTAEGTSYHMLVVKVINAEQIQVIRMTHDGVKEGAKLVNAGDVTVLHYECEFKGERAIENARNRHGDEYDPDINNDEHFVTQARTGTPFSNSCGDESSGASEVKISYTPRPISCLHNLNPGDHIRVRGSGLMLKSRFFLHSASTSRSSGKKWAAYTHHMLVVKVMDSKRIQIIHKADEGVVEETVTFEPKQITVLDYECKYPGSKAIERARDHHSEKYGLLKSNCEHFVTEARTGSKSCDQFRLLGQGGAIGVGVGAPLGVAVGVGAGATVGAGVGGMILPVVGALPGAVAGAVVGGIFGVVGAGIVGAAGGGVAGLKLANQTAKRN